MGSLLNSNLHIHSFYSDGVFSPAKLSSMCEKRGLERVSLTDHNSVSGLQEFAAGSLLGKTSFVPGVEFSCCFNSKALQREIVLHLLAYFPQQMHETALRTAKYVERRFNGFCRKIRRQANERRAIQVALLEESGLNISFNEVFRSCLHRSPDYYPNPEVTMDDLALCLSRRNSLFREDAAKMLSFGGKFHLGKTNEWDLVSVEEVVEKVGDFGGFTSIAHPLKKIPEEKLGKALKELKEIGVDAVEAFNKCTAEQAVKVVKTARKLCFGLTHGNDFHGKKSIESILPAEFNCPWEHSFNSSYIGSF